MSDGETTSPSTASATTATVTFTLDISEKIHSAIQSLSSIVDPSLIPSDSNLLFLLHEPNIYSHIASLLRQPKSGAGDNNLCRWLYDTFQFCVPELQLLVLRFLPVIAGVYLPRVADRKPQAGFEAVLLALYAHETTSRGGEAVTVTIPDMSQPSVYHESKALVKNNSGDHNVVILSPALEPHGTVRSTRRARIVGVAFELFYNKISQFPIASKIDFCEFCKVWAGEDGDIYKDFEDGEEEEYDDEEEEEKKEKEEHIEEVVNEKSERGRVPLPWELLQPVLRILAHCLLGPDNKDVMLFEVASDACRCLFARAMHDVDANAILPTRSLLRLSKNVLGNTTDDFDPTELPKTDVIVL